MAQKPLGPADEFCPLYRKPCNKVCHTCKWWGWIRVENRNTGQEIDQWDCAMNRMVQWSMEGAFEARHGASATESFRNVMVTQNNALLGRALDDGFAPPANPKLIGN